MVRVPVRREQVASGRERGLPVRRAVTLFRSEEDSGSAVARRHAISEQTIYTWKKRFGGFQADDVRRLKQLEAENARLKKLVAERDLEIEVMKEVAAKKW